MIDRDLDDYVLGVAEAAAMRGEPLTYAVGPMSDRRVKHMFRQHNLIAPMDRLCASINRLVGKGVLRKEPTGEHMVGSSSCQAREYPFVELQPIGI